MANGVKFPVLQIYGLWNLMDILMERREFFKIHLHRSWLYLANRNSEGFVDNNLGWNFQGVNVLGAFCPLDH